MIIMIFMIMIMIMIIIIVVVVVVVVVVFIIIYFNSNFVFLGWLRAKFRPLLSNDFSADVRRLSLPGWTLHVPGLDLY